MSVVPKALYEKKGKLWNRAKEINDATLAEGRAFTPEEKTEYDRVNEELSNVCATIERTKALATVGAGGEDDEERDGKSPLPGRGDSGKRSGKKSRRERRSEAKEETRELAFAGWCRAQLDRPLRREHIRACEEIGLNPQCRKMVVQACSTRAYREAQLQCRIAHPTTFLRALSAANLATGGALIPTSFVNALEKNMLYVGGMLTEAEVIRTATGGDMQWPTADDASNEGSLVGESVSVDSGETDPAFAQQTWGAYKFKSGVIKAPYELLEDAAFDLASELGAMIGERIGRAKNRKFTVGTGSNQPEGITLGAATGKTAAATTSFTTNEVLDLIHSVDPIYRMGAKLMMHDSVVLLLRKFKETGTDQYIWQPGLKDGVPDRFLGYEIAINQHMASSVVASAVSMLFGQFRQYKIREVGSYRFYRLSERYRDNDQDGFLAFQRADGRLLRASSSNTAVKKLVQAP